MAKRSATLSISDFRAAYTPATIADFEHDLEYYRIVYEGRGESSAHAVRETLTGNIVKDAARFQLLVLSGYAFLKNAEEEE